MVDTNVPKAYVATCVYCAIQLDTREPRVYQGITGWALNKNQGNSVTLGKRSHQWACNECIDKLKHHVPIGQQSLFGHDA